MKYQLVETKKIIDRVLKFSETHPNSMHNPAIVVIMDLYQEYPEIFRGLHIYEIASENVEETAFKTNYIFIKVPYNEDNSRFIPETLDFSNNDLKCMQKVTIANPNLLRLQSLYSRWDLEWSWSQSSFFSIFMQMLYYLKATWRKEE